MKIETTLRTDIGRKRNTNEDFGITLNFDYGELRSDGTPSKIYILAVADGMGGHLGGEKASEVTIDAISMYLLKFLVRLKQNKRLVDRIEDELRIGIDYANRRVRHSSKMDSALEGMGSTITACIILEDKAIIGNVGDSRAYLLRNGEIARITKDHSLVQSLVDNHEIGPEEAFEHPQRNIITRAIGIDERVEVDIFNLHLNAGDMIMLCSDGLHDMLRDKEIRDCLVDSDSLDEAAKILVDKANEKGGEDNITVVLARTGRLSDSTRRNGKQWIC